MALVAGTDRAPVALVRDFILESGRGRGDRLPPERELAKQLAVTRSSLRQALAVLEVTGEINRHVGRGTFVKSISPDDVSASEFSLVASMTSPYDVIDARFVIEPHIAVRAAQRARKIDHWEIERLLREGEAIRDPQASQKKGDALHRAFAVATHNPLLLALFDAVYRVREATSWGLLHPNMMPPAQLFELWRQHRAIAEAIAERNAPEAERRMREHVQAIQDSLQLR
jgi:DNA-binding FadR family transcriptional regulator